MGSKWYQCNVNNSDVVLYSKVRVARNLADAPFPERMSAELRKSVSKNFMQRLRVHLLQTNLTL